MNKTANTLHSVVTADEVKISFRHVKSGHNTALIIAPGFFQSKETKTYKSIEASFTDSFDVITMDFRGHGKSKGLYTFSAKEHYDLAAVGEFAKRQYKWVGVLGFSYGGSIALITQHFYRLFQAVICVGSPMASEKIEFHWWKPESFKSCCRGMQLGAGCRFSWPFLKKTKPVNIVGDTGEVPLLFIHGTIDPTVFPIHSKMLYEHAKEPKKIVMIKGAGHAQDIFITHRKDAVRITKEWLQQQADDFKTLHKT